MYDLMHWERRGKCNKWYIRDPLDIERMFETKKQRAFSIKNTLHFFSIRKMYSWDLESWKICNSRLLYATKYEILGSNLTTTFCLSLNFFCRQHSISGEKRRETLSWKKKFPLLSLTITFLSYLKKILWSVHNRVKSGFLSQDPQDTHVFFCFLSRMHGTHQKKAFIHFDVSNVANPHVFCFAVNLMELCHLLWS